MTMPGLLIPEWSAPARVHAAFTLRTGGVSQPPFDTLNLGKHVGDAPEVVDENRRRVREALNMPAEPAWLEQVHGTEVIDLDRSPPTFRGDAAVTRTAGRVCVIQVADCMPVLFACLDGSVVGAAHAGWRGLAGGVLEATVRAMAVDPARLVAWMGPAIGPANFEVGEEVRAAFIAGDPGAESAFTRNERGRFQCDLYALARRRLEAIGVHAISGGGWCTYGDPKRFFSYRRDGACGRMGAFIWLRGGNV